MGKRTEKGEQRCAEITAAALELFFEHGYEATSIRMIQDKVGYEVSLFYHYYESKDSAFEAAIRLFFKAYEERVQSMVDSGKEHPEGGLSHFFECVEVEVTGFRIKYLNKLHWSILSAIREYTVRIMPKYVAEILHSYASAGIYKRPESEIPLLANLVSYCVGSSMIYQSEQDYKQNREHIMKKVSDMLDIPVELL